MNTKLLSTVFAFVCLLGTALVVQAQTPAVTPKAVSFTSEPKMTLAKLKNGDQDAYEVRGKATFTITAANTDDTLVGTFNYTIPDDARQKIAAISGKQLNAVPSNVTRKDVLAYFQEGTLAPVVHLEIKPTEFDVTGVKMAFNRIVIDVNGHEASSSSYTREEVEALISVWAKQIYNKRSRRGVIARLNKVINGEPPE